MQRNRFGFGLREAALTVVALGCIAGGAIAQNANVSYSLEFSNTPNLDIYDPFFNQTLDVDAGALAQTWNNGTQPSTMPTSSSVYCVDLQHYLSSPVNVTLESTSTFTNGMKNSSNWGEAAWLYNTYAPGIVTSKSSSNSGALQLALWYALDGNGGNTVTTSGSGFFVKTDNLNSASSIQTMIQQADTYLSNASGKTSTATVFWAKGSGQDMVGPAPSGGNGGGGNGPGNVPEPASVLMFGAGMLPVAGLLRRGRRRVR